MEAMNLGRRISPLLVLATLSLATGDAHADEIDPAEAACGEVGDSCEIDGKKGTCQKATCTTLDYSNMADGGPSTREYDCAKCVPGAKSKSSAEPEPSRAKCAVGTSTSLGSFALGLLVLGLVARRRR